MQNVSMSNSALDIDEGASRTFHCENARKKKKEMLQCNSKDGNKQTKMANK